MKILSKINSEIEKMYETLADLSTDEAERHAVQQHEMYLIDKYALIHEAEEKVAIEMAKQMLLDNVPDNKISKYSKLPLKTIIKLKTEI